MTDDSGIDAKILAVPDDKTSLLYSHWRELKDVNTLILQQLQHFFQHYKDLEVGRWAKVGDWADIHEAQLEITQGIARYKHNKSFAAEHK